jgi:NTE family protein
MKPYQLYVLGIALMLALPLNSLRTQPAPPAPRLGLALSGGGAKGLAHIGVLKVLEAEGIFPDYVSGTSMGSIVGGLYAIGYTPAELEALAKRLDWNSYFNDNYPRNFLPIAERSKADRYQLSFALENGRLKIPRGLIGGKKIQNLLTGITANVHDIPTFDQYYIPFRCVATDLETGGAYVFGRGPLRKGIRASMSIPSAFDPLLYDNHLLVDGLLARNLPVQDVLEMGADFAIGVDVGDPLYPREELNSVLRVLEQTSSFGMVASTDTQRALAGYVIDPDLTGFSTLSYDQVDSLIARGTQAAQAALPQLRNYLDSVGWVSHPVPDRFNARRDSFYVKKIIFSAPDTTTNKTLAQIVNIQTPAVVTIAELDKWVGILYSSGFFADVDYEFAHAREGGGYTLRFTGTSTPDFYLRGSINYDVDFNAGLLLNFTARNQIGYGSLITADVRVSAYPGFWLDYTINTRSTPSFGVQVYTSGQVIPGQLFEQNELVDEFTFHQYQAGVALQTGISRQWYFRMGLEAEHFSENPRFFSLTELTARAQHLRGFAELIRDTYDRTYFPRDGSFSQLWIHHNLTGKLEDGGEGGVNFSTTGFVTLSAKTNKTFPLGRRWWLDAAVAVGHAQYQDDHLLQRFYLGREIPENPRFFEVYGLRLTELDVSTFAYGRVQFRTEIGHNNFLGVGYNYGYTALIENKMVRSEGAFNGLGLELGSITPLGPVRFTAEYNLDFRRFNFSLYAGYRF